jgi:hypothetical protein
MFKNIKNIKTVKTGDAMLKANYREWNVYIPLESGPSSAVGRGGAGCEESKRVRTKVLICGHVMYR